VGVKPNAMELLEQNLASRQKAASKRTDKQLSRQQHFRDLVERLLNGHHLTAIEGRELYWEVMAQCEALEADPFTGNSQTYYNLGLQVHPRFMQSLAKNISIELFHKMEREAITRKNEESK